MRTNCALVVLVVAAITYCESTFAQKPQARTESLKVLFVGNSYTARHRLANVVEALAEEANPNLDFQPTTVIYGGRTLKDHWELRTQNIVAIHQLTTEDQSQTVAGLQQLVKDKPSNKYAPAALKRHRQLLKDLEQQRTKWDVIVLQSYRDDLKGADSLYVKYAPRYAKLAKQQGARVVLYETTPATQNSTALKTKPDAEPVLAKEKVIGKLALDIDASVAPMSMVALNCQTERPDLTLRFVNDGHLNQTMAYLTACTLYSALFEKSPIGLSVDSVTDIRYWQNKDKTRDRDNQPIKKVFNDNDRADLQRIAWESYQAFKKLKP